MLDKFSSGWTYVETLWKYCNHVWVETTVIKARDLLLVPHVLAIAVEGQDQTCGSVLVVAFRDMDEKFASGAITRNGEWLR